ncbi:preprotein translocase subunit SecG [Intestinibacillus massiliensis]|uniref:preprotein translocase subunit SecG n=1 Tax=Intestinibacillus massiliensis TaxID=1871029 RepID=UPI001D099D51|nr:preprotein translocase subunit SecG [Intestinibacillus massiliensis]MCB6366131.1 preprotein translocase subunit SecG [Intestinibacillus massiliensis]
MIATMGTLKFALSVIEVLACLFLIVTILLQHGKAQGLGTIAGGAETFFSSNKARGMDAILSKITTVVAFLFVALAVVLNLIPNAG